MYIEMYRKVLKCTLLASLAMFKDPLVRQMYKSSDKGM